MKFSSIKEYFYKLYNVCYMITLIPLGVFIYLYLKLQAIEINTLIKDPQEILIAQIAIFFVIAAVLTSVHLVISKRMKSLSKKFGLGDKMDKYYSLSITRILVGAVASVIAGIGLLFTGSEIFSVYFLLILLWMAYHWPVPKRMCVELRLKGDEKEMILYKRESLN